MFFSILYVIDICIQYYCLLYRYETRLLPFILKILNMLALFSSKKYFIAKQTLHFFFNSAPPINFFLHRKRNNTIIINKTKVLLLHPYRHD